MAQKIENFATGDQSFIHKSIHPSIYKHFNSHILHYKDTVFYYLYLLDWTYFSQYRKYNSCIGCSHHAPPPQPTDFPLSLWFTLRCPSSLGKLSKFASNYPWHSPHLSSTGFPHPWSFMSFTLPSVTEISALIHQSKPSPCHVDPLSTSTIKACTPSLAPVIMATIHCSLSSHTLPSVLKTTSITSILKKPGCHSLDFNNFRPISNLPLLSKLLEKLLHNNLSDNLHKKYLISALSTPQKRP